MKTNGLVSAANIVPAMEPDIVDNIDDKDNLNYDDYNEKTSFTEEELANAGRDLYGFLLNLIDLSGK